MSSQTPTSIISATPFRVSFFGGGTDLPSYFNRHGGTVIATTIAQYSYVALNSLEPLLQKRFRISYSALEMCDRIEDIKHDITRTILTDYPDLLGDRFIDIHSYADLPSGTGIGSSSAFAVGMLNALHALSARYVPPKELAKRAITIERERLAEAGGWQDQVLAAYGGVNMVRFGDNDFEVEPLVLSGESRTALEQSCWLYFTGVTRSSAKVQNASFLVPNATDTDRILDETHELAREAMRLYRHAASAVGLVRDWGLLMDRAWTVKRSLSSAVSSPEIDAAYERAKHAGAYGGKVIGAGGGGFLLIMGPPGQRAAIDAAVGDMHCIPLRFESIGSRIVYVNGK